MIVHLSANKGQNSQTDPGARLSERHWDWTSAALLLLAVLMASWRLVATEWTEDLQRLQLLATLAAAFGLLLGASRFPRWAAGLLGAAYGLFFIPWQLGLTVLQSVDWNERLLSLWGRLLFSVSQLVGQENVEDPILFQALVGVVLWAVCLNAGYVLMRHRDAWRAILPLGMLLVVLHTYDARIVRRVWYLASYMLFGLMLVARVHLLRQKEQWRAGGTQLPRYLGLDMLRSTLLAASVLVVLAWVTPALAASDNPAQSVWEAITKPWRNVRGDLGRAFYSLEGAAVVVNDYYGTELQLGRGNAQNSQIVLAAEVLGDTAAPARYYWRDRIYDIYENGGWRGSFPAEQRLRADEYELLFPEWEGRTLARLRITTGRSIMLLHTPTQPLWISRTADFSYAPIPGGAWDIAALSAPVPLRPGESYEVEAYLSTVSISQLRAAGTDYPDWVSQRYLQVPEEITLRTLELARELAEGQETPYDIAAAITDWLRANIEYVDSLPQPPADGEPIDWMLFEQQQAFCNYYATAEILMLRSLGIPARMAVGYAQGELSESNPLLGGADTEKEELLEEIALEGRYYTVRQRDVHAWPEVYFPGIGWVEFEPTVNQAPLLRPLGGEQEGEINAAEAAAEAESPETPASELDLTVLEGRLAEREAAAAAAEQRTRLALALAAIALLLVALFWQRYRQRGGAPVPVLLEKRLQRLEMGAPRPLRAWASYARLAPLPQAYMEINRALRRLGTPPRAGDTPEERTATLRARLPRLAPVVDELSARYQHALYSGVTAQDEGAQRAKWAIRIASLLEVLRGWMGNVERKREKHDCS